MIVSFSWIVDCLYAFSARFSPYGVAFSCYFVNAISCAVLRLAVRAYKFA